MKARIVKRKNKTGLDKIRSAVEEIHGEAAKAGFFIEQGNHESGMPYTKLMAIHEFGDDENNIPKRPVFQIVGHRDKPQNSMEMRRMLRQWSNSIYRGGDGAALLDSVGQFYQGSLKSVYGDTGLLQSNSPRTIAKKGRNDPLIDSGELLSKVARKNTITNKVEL